MKMKTKITFFAILISLVLFNSCAIHRTANIASNPLMGTWELVSFQYGTGALQIFSDEDPVIRQKWFSKTRFITVTYAETGQIKRINGGTYTFDGNVYIENVQFSAPHSAPGQTKFTIEFSGGEMQISGILSSGGSLTEVWRKME
jgi:cell division protein YceG involved in septum cleavage